MNTKPLISVLVPLFNHENYIKEAIESVLSQSYDHFELILINDGSSDNSEEVVTQFTDKRLHYYNQDNMGAHATINKAITMAQGEFISILNSDDSYHQQRLERCLQEFHENPALIAAFTHINIIEDKNITSIVEGKKDNWGNTSDINTYGKNNDLLLNLLGGNFLKTTSNLFCRKNVFKDVGMFKNYRYCHDYDLFLKLALRYRDRIKIIQEPLLNYRIHESNTINENSYRSVYENSLVLARLLNSMRFEEVADKNNTSVSDIEYFYNSLQTWSADRLILSLVVTTREWHEDDYLAEAANMDSPLFKAFLNNS